MNDYKYEYTLLVGFGNTATVVVEEELLRKQKCEYTLTTVVQANEETGTSNFL